MNISRIGLILLIVGLVVLLNSWSSHVPRYARVSIGEAKVNETLSYSAFIAPVGIGNVTIGSRQQTGSSMPPELGMNKPIVLPVHLVIKGPTNQKLIEKDVVTPYSNQIIFNERGEYTIHITNKGTEASPIPIEVTFLETGDNSNRETDKFNLSIILLISGLALVCINLIANAMKKQKFDKP